MIERLTQFVVELIERGYVPDSVTRAAIRELCRRRLRVFDAKGNSSPGVSLERFANEMRSGPIALVPEIANEQHYELPADFFSLLLGPRRKYSCCHWTAETKSLQEAEVSALQQTCERAEIRNGMSVLELGCGWGSLTLWIAEQFPDVHITAVSNSASQRAFIESEAQRLGVSGRIDVITADMNEFATDRQFDRVVSVEMFEHMRNYERLLDRICTWLKADGKLFVHVFCHRRWPYEFTTEGPANWMGRHFFTGGIMPSLGLLERFDKHMQVARKWNWSGVHYQKTCNAWLAQLDAKRDQATPILERVYGKTDTAKWLQRWRMFFMACAELFGYDDGKQWLIAHYLMEPVVGRHQLDPPDSALSLRQAVVDKAI